MKDRIPTRIAVKEESILTIESTVICQWTDTYSAEWQELAKSTMCFQKVTDNYNMTISVEKTKIIAFKWKWPNWSKVVINDHVLSWKKWPLFLLRQMCGPCLVPNYMWCNSKEKALKETSWILMKF